MKKSKIGLKITVILAMLSAISIILGKYLAIRGGDIMRFSLENMPIIFAGIAFGPVAGAIVGSCADLIGCLLVGYTINPIVTLGGAAIGIISGIVPRYLSKTKLDGRFVIAITVGLTHFIGSVIIKTIGLSAYYDTPFEFLLGMRLINYIIVGLLDGIIVYILLNNKEIKAQIKAIREEKNDLRRGD